MSKNCSLKILGLTKAAAEKALGNKPAGECEMFFMPETELYYCLSSDKRKNALVYCTHVNTWRSSVRYNSELSDKKLFIPLSDIACALKKKQ